MSEDNPKYELITYNGHNEKYVGQQVRQYQDGSLRDSRGYFIESHPAGTQITSKDARALASTRWEIFREAAADAVQREVGAIAPGITTPSSAWGVLNGRLAVQIMDSDKPRGRDLEHLGRNMGAIPTVFDGTEQAQAGITLSEGVAGKLLDLLREKADIIDAE